MPLIFAVPLYFLLNTVLLFSMFVLLNSILDRRKTNWYQTGLSFVIVAALVTLYIIVIPPLAVGISWGVFVRVVSFAIAYSIGRNIDAWI